MTPVKIIPNRSIRPIPNHIHHFIIPTNRLPGFKFFGVLPILIDRNSKPMAWGKQKKHAPIAGLDIGPARLTPLGWFWILVYLGLPIMVLGNLIDAWIQFQWGWCIGIWCVI